MEVNIYINTHHTGHLSKGTGKYGIILEYTRKTGLEETREYFKGLKNTTKHRTALKACIEALEYLTKPCYVNLHINNTYVTETMINEYYYKWNFENWTNGDKPVKNADLWEQLFKLLALHRVTFYQAETNPYTSYIQTKLRASIEYTEDRKEQYA